MLKGKVLVFLFLAAVFFLTACGSGQAVASEEDAEKAKVLKEDATGEDISLTSSHVALEGRFEKAIVQDDTVYGCSLSAEGLTVIRQDVQSKAVLQQILIADVDEVYGLVAAQDDAVLVVASQEGIVSCWKISAASSQAELLYEDIGLEDLEGGEVSDCLQICQDEEGNYYIWINAVLPASRYQEDADEKTLMNVGRVYVKDSQMRTLYYEEIPVLKGSRMLGFCIDEDGNPLILAKDSGGSYLKILDVDTQESAKQRIDGLEAMADSDAFAVVEGGLLYCQGTYLYEYRVEEQSIATLLDLSAFGITASDIIYLNLNDGVCEIVDNYGTDNSEYACIREGVSEKTVLTLGTTSDMESGYLNLYKCVTEFNRYNEDIRIELVSYYDETEEGGSGIDVGRDQMSLDLISGTAPDLIVVTESMRDMLADKGVFVDLYEMMEEDPDFGRDDLMTQVTDLYEIDGKLYSLAPDFFLMTIWGSSEVIQGRTGVTLTEFEEILKENGRDVNAVWGFSADEDVLITLCKINWDVLIDWESRTCDFESETFRMLMEFAAERVIGSSTGVSYREGIMTGECLMEMGSVTSVADHQLEEAIWDTDLEYIGYPTESGSGTALKFISEQLAINANCEQKEAAWEFLKYYLTNGLSGHGFPVVTALFEEQMELAMEDDYEWAIDLERMELIPKDNFYDPSTDEFIYVYKASQEDVDTVIALINRADRRYYSFTDVENIITEEAAYYFAGQKSFEEVAALIQNRVQLYLNEG